MESNWRWNVADFGFVGSGLRLLARRIDLPNYLIGIGMPPDPRRILLFYVYDPDQLPLLLGPLPYTSRHFPAGYDVEPD